MLKVLEPSVEDPWDPFYAEQREGNPGRPGRSCGGLARRAVVRQRLAASLFPVVREWTRNLIFCHDNGNASVVELVN